MNLAESWTMRCGKPRVGSQTGRRTTCSENFAAAADSDYICLQRISSKKCEIACSSSQALSSGLPGARYMTGASRTFLSNEERELTYLAFPTDLTSSPCFRAYLSGRG